jgi:hypothetical protein
MTYLCSYEGYVGVSPDLTEAFNILRDLAGNDINVSDCDFYEATKITAVMEVKPVITSTIKKVK